MAQVCSSLCLAASEFVESPYNSLCAQEQGRLWKISDYLNERSLKFEIKTLVTIRFRFWGEKGIDTFLRVQTVSKLIELSKKCQCLQRLISRLIKLISLKLTIWKGIMMRTVSTSYLKMRRGKMRRDRKWRLVKSLPSRMSSSVLSWADHSFELRLDGVYDTGTVFDLKSNSNPTHALREDHSWDNGTVQVW